MKDYIAICLPKKLVTELIAKSVVTLDTFLQRELPEVIDQHEEHIETVCIQASSSEMVIKILSWKKPDLYVIYVRSEHSDPPVNE